MKYEKLDFLLNRHEMFGSVLWKTAVLFSWVFFLQYIRIFMNQSESSAIRGG